MSKGIVVTDGTDFDYSGDNDITLDSRLKGGMKIAQTKFIKPAVEMTYDSNGGAYYGSFSHGLGFVPAVICFQDGVIGIAAQNSAFPNQPSVNADNQNVYYQCGDTTTLCIVIFDEKVADS